MADLIALPARSNGRPWRNRLRGGLYRGLVVSLAVVAALALLTLGLWHLPGQVENRARRALRALLAASVEVDLKGASADLGGSVSFDRVAIAAAPVVSGPTLVAMRDVRAVDDTLVSPNPAGVPPTPARVDAREPWKRIMARHARFDLEAGVVGSGASPGSRLWNFQRLLRAELEAGGSTRRFICTIDSFEMAARAVDAGPALELRGAELEMMGWLDGAAVLVRGKWTGAGGATTTAAAGPRGDFEATISPRVGVLSGRATLDGLDDLGRIAPFCPSSVARLDRGLRPRGLLDLSASLERRDGAARFSAVLRPVERTSLTVLDGALVLEHASGRIEIEGETVHVGGAASDGAVLGSVAGHEARLRGVLREGADDLVLELPRIELASVERLPAPARVHAIAGALGLRGPGSVRYTLRSLDAPRRAVSVVVDTEGARAERLALVSRLEATVSSDAIDGDATIALDVGACEVAGFGTLEGVVRLAPTGSGTRITLEKVGLGKSGTLRGSIELGEDGALGAIEMRSSELSLARGLLEIAVESARARFETTERDDSSTEAVWSARVDGVLGGAALATRRLPDQRESTNRTLPSTLRFERGAFLGTIGADGLTAGIDLRGGTTEAPFALRLKGAIALDGVVDIHGILAFDAAARALSALPADTAAERWFEALGRDVEGVKGEDGAEEAPEPGEGAASEEEVTSKESAAEPKPAPETPPSALPFMVTGTLSRPAIRWAPWQVANPRSGE